MRRPEISARIRERELMISELEELHPRSKQMLDLINIQINSHRAAISGYMGLRNLRATSGQYLSPSDIELKEKIVKLITDYYHIDIESLIQKSRKTEKVHARQILFYLLRNTTKYSLSSIGNMFGGRDHTTVIHSCQTVLDLMDSDPRYKEEVECLYEQIV